jgi:glycosyltransferase involved in cell wall biosynthesis
VGKSGEAVGIVKLNWFSPVPPTASAVALHNAAALPALTKHADVTVWVHEERWAADLEQHARVRRYDPTNVPWTDINAADATIYHLGNHPDFHGPIWQVNRQHPGIVVLHDLCLQHLFANLVIRNLGLSGDEYREMMSFHHPDGGRELADAVLSNLLGVDKIAEHCPLTGAALEHAVGVIVHTQAGYAALKSSTTLPVAYVPLIALPAEAVAGEAAISRPSNPNDSVYRIIIFGFLSPNRRLESILKALCDFPQKHRFRLDIYGSLPDENSFRQIVTELSLNDLVSLHGFVPPAKLRQALAEADLAINLRDPTMGEASASQLRIWQEGLPSLVTQIGWYATLPPDTVAFVRRENEIRDIQNHLMNFLRSPETYREIGRNGRRYVEDHHTVEAYVGGLLALVETTLQTKSREAVSWMAGRAGRAIRPWFSQNAAGVLLPHVAESISDLFDSRANNGE